MANELAERARATADWTYLFDAHRMLLLALADEIDRLEAAVDAKVTAAVVGIDWGAHRMATTLDGEDQ